MVGYLLFLGLVALVPADPLKSKNEPELFNLDQYNRYATIRNWMSTELSLACGVRCSMYSLQPSYDGQPIEMFKIMGNGNARGSILVDAAMHGNEWISVAVILKLMDRLVNEYAISPDIRDMVDKFDWYFIPVVNPDAYELGFTEPVLCRGICGKTTKPFGDGCIGVDINRNFDVNWAGVGSSVDPCAGNYHGPTVWSEVETRNVRDALNSIRQNSTAYVSLHSFGQLLMYPYGIPGATAPNELEQRRCAIAAAAAIGTRYGTEYVVDTTRDALYPVSGSATDWAYFTGAVEYSYAWELSSRGNGQVIPESLIPEISIESHDGFFELARQMVIQ